MQQKTRMQGAGLVVVGLAGLLVSAHYQMQDNKEAADKVKAKVSAGAEKVVLTAKSHYDEVRVKIQQGGGNRQFVAKLRDKDEQGYNVYRETVVGRKGMKISFYVTPPGNEENAYCYITQGEHTVSKDSDDNHGVAYCEWVVQ